MPFQKCHAQKCFLSCSYFMLHLKTFNIALLVYVAVDDLIAIKDIKLNVVSLYALPSL